MATSFLGAARARDRVVACRIGGYSREQCGLVQLEEPRALSEVRPRRLLDAVRAVSEVDRVQVRREDAVLAPALLELPGERRLPHLARERPLVPDVRVLDELLGDGGAAFDDRLLAHVGPERAGDPAQVDALVVEEALILDGDDRLAHDRRDVLGRHQHAVLVASQNGEHPLAVRGVDHGVHVRALRCRIEGRDLARHGSHEAEGERQERTGRTATPRSAARRRLRTRRRRRGVTFSLRTRKGRSVGALHERRGRAAEAFKDLRAMANSARADSELAQVLNGRRGDDRIVRGDLDASGLLERHRHDVTASRRCRRDRPSRVRPALGRDRRERRSLPR